MSEQSIPVRFMVVPDLLDKFYPTEDDHRFEVQYAYLRMIQTTDGLILDGLGTERGTPWGREKLFQILNYRYDYQLPTIITLNAPLNTLAPAILTFLTDTVVCRHMVIDAPDVRMLPAARRKRKKHL